jgi:hypothetical protein
VTGPEHYKAAEQEMKYARDLEASADWGPMELALSRAQVHATLAHTSATLFAALIGKMPLEVDPEGDAAVEWFAAIFPEVSTTGGLWDDAPLEKEWPT